MSTISHYPAVQQINFYVTEASEEMLKERRSYLENNLLPIWNSRLEEMLSWSTHSEMDLELIAAYKKGVDFLTQALDQGDTA